MSDVIETQIARAAAEAFAQARRRAFQANQAVVVSENGNLVRISPTGERKVIGEVKAPTEPMSIKIEKDVEISIRWAEPRD